MVYKNDSVFQVITGKKQWMQLLFEIGDFDFYHTYDYHCISKSDGERPKLIVYRKQDKIIALPIIVRPISNTDYFDATSVYGYVGPLTKNITEKFDTLDFQLKLNTFFKKENIISVFTRLNPFLPYQEHVLNKLGKIEKLGKIIYIDLLDSEIEQTSGYSRTTKRYLKKLKDSCYCKISNEYADILRFIDLYYENMDRVEAASEYYFGEKYFRELLNSPDFDAELMFVHLKDTDEAIAAALIVKTSGRMAQYHISGTLMSHLKISPMRFLIDQMRAKCSEENYNYFNIGGGLGGQNDSLLQFKSSLSKKFKTFKVWKYIVDENVYNKLSNEVKTNPMEKRHRFFPSYRSKF